MKEIIIKQIKIWLGIAYLETKMKMREAHLKELDRRIDELSKKFNAQMDMVGVDIGMKANSRIIFISRLGGSNTGGGTVHIVDAHFKSFVELSEFMRYCEQAFPDRTIEDRIIGMRDGWWR